MHETNDTPQPTTDAAPRTPFSIVRVLAALAGCIFAAAIGLAAFAYWNGSPDTLVPVTGTVLWNDKPVTVGAVMTIPQDDPLLGTLGALDGSGQFSLETNGKPGAVRGRHKLVVAAFGVGMPPPPLVPAEYTTFDTTPLWVEVSSDPAKNDLQIRLQGELPERRNRGRGGRSRNNSSEGDRSGEVSDVPLDVTPGGATSDSSAEAPGS